MGVGTGGVSDFAYTSGTASGVIGQDGVGGTGVIANFGVNPLAAYVANGFTPQFVVDETTTDAPTYYSASSVATYSDIYTTDTTAGGLCTQNDSSGNLVWGPHNLFINSESPATQNITVVVGAQYTVEMEGTGSIALTGAGTGTASAGSPATITASTTTLTCTVSGSPTRGWAYRSDLGGMADVISDQRTSGAPANYLATGGSAEYALRRRHYRYTGTSYVPTLLHEPVGATNLDPNSDDLSAWTTSNTTIAKNQTGADGVANSAHSITATANNGTALEQITAASAAHAWGCLMKRITGTGTVEVTVNGGTTWVDITSDLSTSVYLPVSTGAGVTVTNPEFGVRLGTSGDVVAVQVSQLEQTSGFISSPIPTTGASVTRPADTCKVKAAALPYDSTTLSMSQSCRLSYSGNDNARFFSWFASATERFAGIVISADDDTDFFPVAQSFIGNATAGAAVTPAPDVEIKFAWRTNISSEEVQCARAGGAGTAVVFTRPMPAVSSADLGVFDRPGAATNPVNGELDTLILWSDDIAQAGLESTTS